MAILSENLITKGKEKVIPESEVKKLIDDSISVYVDGKLKELEQKFETKIENKETKTTEILAIFITLFTFISVNINIFTRVQDLHSAVWFMLIFTMCSLLLLSCLFMVISSRKNYFIISILIFSMLFLFGLLVATKYMPSWNPILNNTQDNQQQTIKIVK